MNNKKMTENDLRAELWFLVVKYARSNGITSGDAWISPLMDRLVTDITKQCGPFTTREVIE